MPFASKLAGDDHFGRDAGVIGAGKPERDIAFHAVPADGDVDRGVLQHVAHVERAGYVRRGDDKREDGFTGLPFGVIDTAFNPPLGPPRLKAPGLINFI